MDWAAIGGVAAVVAVIVAIIQLKKSSRPQPTIGTPVDEPVRISATVARGDADLDRFDSLKVGFRDEKYEEFGNIRSTLSNISFAIVTLKNEEKSVARRVNGFIRVTKPLNFQIESAVKLGKHAIKLTSVDDGLQFYIEEMPAGETISISIIAGGRIGWNVEPLNAAVEFKGY